MYLIFLFNTFLKIWKYDSIRKDEEIKGNDFFKQVMKDAVKNALDGKIMTMESSFAEYLYYDTVAIVNNNELMNKIASCNFDLAIIDGFYIVRYLFIIPHHFGIPFISVSETSIDPMMRYVASPAFAPNLITLHTERMTFFERVKNTTSLTVMTNFKKLAVPYVFGKKNLHRYRLRDDITDYDDIAIQSNLLRL